MNWRAGAIRVWNANEDCTDLTARGCLIALISPRQLHPTARASPSLLARHETFLGVRL